MNFLTKAKNILEKENLTCVFYNGDAIIRHTERGIKPLIETIETLKTLKGYCAVDKIVGRAAAFLYIKLEVNELFCEVISEGAIKLLEEANVCFEYRTKTEKIINRHRDGECPMEIVVKNADTPKKAEELIRKKLKKL